MSKKTILLATDSRFWLEDRGNRVRAASLVWHLRARGYWVWIYFTGSLEESEKESIKVRYPDLIIYTLSSVGRSYRSKTGKNLLEPLSKKTLTISRTLQSFRKRISITSREAICSISRKLLKNHNPAWLKYLNENRLSDFYSRGNLESFQSLCMDLKPDFIIIESARLAYLIWRLGPYLRASTRTLFDAHDVLSHRCRDFHTAGERHWVRISEKEEKRLLDHFDAIIAIQSMDAAVFRRMLPGKPVLTVGHAAEARKLETFAKPYLNISYIGTEGPHSRQAISNFIARVWPSLYRRFGGQIRLNIAGSVCKKIDSSSLPEGVHLKGFVQDLTAFYTDTDIAINPVLFGGGLKIKNVEALCYGKPLVTTPVGAEGLEQGTDKCFYVCDTPDAFIERLSQLIGDPALREEMAEKAYHFALENFSDRKAFSDLYEYLEKDPI